MTRRKLRILFLVLEMDLGGLQRMVNQLIKSLDKETFEPYLVCLDRGGIFYEEAAGLCARSYILERRPGPFDRKLFLRLVSILRQNRIDMIHSHNGCSSYAALAGKLAGVRKIIHTDHGRLVPDRMSARMEDRLASYFMDRFIGVSTELSDYLECKVGIRKKRLMTIINGVNTETFRPRSADEKSSLRSRLGLRESDRIIGTVCRLDPIKNLTFMISCMPVIVQKMPAAKLVIAGDGPQKKILDQQATDLGMVSFIKFLGLRQNVEDILPAFDVYACTSLSEGTSMTILEAMACGLPVVATNVGGNSRLVDKSNGILVQLNDQASYTKSVMKLLGGPELIRTLGDESRKKVYTRFSVELMVKQYEELYKLVWQ